ncbi:aminotransferase class I/II-fold pyridoxal phosphate-dependent enzyme [Vibrio sp. CAIM 722]|uniref:Aminotransferase class I/II-fold pyridoxal phosphate-dependent enzyme n=1 Tax=Vibrio eleionomae TaxID=2653505 RepID=A0A7X4LN89_9VIBR|nr:PLP-dependent aminotransferase family protein [Vibrio eleionomae]MZI95039.1 aminotransferase class I/II-fold pyridoxal phosphate-dependent enzyme [Vibrio eleionomae]
METAYSVQQIQSSYIREILAAASDKNVISLAGGLPDEKTFPIHLMKPAIEALTAMTDVFQYGATIGYEPLIVHLTQTYNLPETHRVMTCTGSQQGLDLIARAYVNPNDTVAMEAPCYLGAMQVFGLAQANLVTVSQDESGPDINELELCFKTTSPKMFYAVPDFHNPTGVCWSLEKRNQVATLCIKYNVVLIEDAPYRELRFSGEPLPLVSDFCPDHSIVLRSLSKIASPGLRFGTVSGKQSYLEPLLKVKQGADLHSSTPIQAIILGLLQHAEFPKHLENIRAIYRSRYDTIFRAVQAYLPDECKITPTEGGMFVWVTLPECDTYKLANELLANKVAVVPSPVFYPTSAEPPSAIRLNFTNADPEDLVTAIQRISQVLKNTPY